MHKLLSMVFVLPVGLCCIGNFSAAEGESQPGGSIECTQTDIAGETNGADESAVREQGEAFGEQLKNVSLVGPHDVLRQSIRTHYGGFVTPQLLAEWLINPASAPGRLVSSPWPDRININDVEMHRIDRQTEAEVRGDIVEISSVHEGDGAVASRRPFTLTVVKVGGRWLIDEITFGGESHLIQE